MGKLRSNFTDIPAGLAQWIGRKLYNHEPASAVSAMDKTGREKEVPILALGTDGKPSTNAVLYPLKNGRVFMLTVHELTPIEIDYQAAALAPPPPKSRAKSRW